jgi:hypothetical protein
VSDRGT